MRLAFIVILVSSSAFDDDLCLVAKSANWDHPASEIRLLGLPMLIILTVESPSPAVDSGLRIFGKCWHL